MYAFDIAVPGVGCSGDIPPVSTTSAAPASAATTASQAASTSAPASTAVTLMTTTALAAVTSAVPTAGLDCHTHADGAVHCA